MKWIDLTLTLSVNMPGVYIRQVKTLESDGWNARNLDIYTHAGTHMDAPVHFGIPGPTIDQFTPDQLTGKAWVIDLQNKEDRYLILIEDLGEAADKIQEGDSLIFKTGWSQFVESDPHKYRNRLPRISEDLANWMVAKKIKILAVEPPSVADVNDLYEVTRIHHILFKGGVIIVEGICNVAAIETEQVTLMVCPLKIKDGDGAPARVLAGISE
ncbi:cyclase family protein [Pararhodonellum marinum]|uniref:cyclase family protein n=1 Tax=Pararhodonellum marinum TaxID=2755358 RepID=UPI00188F9AF1|nr:cyclase family protein [Pararhodonellum marinum]